MYNSLLLYRKGKLLFLFHFRINDVKFLCKWKESKSTKTKCLNAHICLSSMTVSTYIPYCIYEALVVCLMGNNKNLWKWHSNQIWGGKTRIVGLSCWAQRLLPSLRSNQPESAWAGNASSEGPSQRLEGTELEKLTATVIPPSQRATQTRQWSELFLLLPLLSLTRLNFHISG